MTLSVESESTYRGGVSIDLGRRHYGIKRLRATWPYGRLRIADGKADLWASTFSLPRGLPLPVSLTPETACVFVRHGWPPGITFKTSGTIHHFWTLHPGPTIKRLQTAGFRLCS